MASTGNIRVTQRAPQSCQQCSTKKMRCSKQIPCSNCIRRGIANQCQRESVIVSKRHSRPSTSKRSRNKDLDHATRSNKNCKAVSGIDRGLENDATPKNPRNKDVQFVLSSPGNSASPINPVEPYSHLIDAHKDLQRSFQTSNPPCSNDQRALVHTYSGETLATEAAVSLESFAWGRHRDVNKPLLVATGNPIFIPGASGIISQEQANTILDFHKNYVAWMHNVIHMPSFLQGCIAMEQNRLVQDNAWMSLYFATGVHYMSWEERRNLGIHNGHAVSKSLYQKTLDMLAEADFMAVPSIYSLQAICVILLCAHSFGEAKRIMVLLSSATSIAQDMNLHRLGPNRFNLLPFEQVVNREIGKRIWCFLSTQDWFLIPFKNCYSIFPNHNTTPLPANCPDDARIICKGQIRDLPITIPTQSSHSIFLYKVADISRSFFDRTRRVDGTRGSIADLYDEVLEADNEMESLARNLPSWIRPGKQSSSDWPPSIFLQRHTFEISFAHKRIIIHQAFFCQSLKDKRYFYTRIVCLDAARTILQRYCNSPDKRLHECWTILAHVLSGAIILTLNILFSNDESNRSAGDLELVSTCLGLLEDSVRLSVISKRKVRILNHLLKQEPLYAKRQFFELQEIVQLMKDMGRIMGEEGHALNLDFNTVDDVFLNMFNLYPQEIFNNNLLHVNLEDQPKVGVAV
ncbi:MAG: hypothetical protein M1834_008384 [Cirrosporium novae-zelandiae]|nr:MAG: hypothetical protein M1834_008384 [Cirrosporium novae-zelandiae]